MTGQRRYPPPCRFYGCTREASHLVRGMPGYEWCGYYCESHADGHRGRYDHQGGCRITRMAR